jgi:hypothetical protein
MLNHGMARPWHGQTMWVVDSGRTRPTRTRLPGAMARYAISMSGFGVRVTLHARSWASAATGHPRSCSAGVNAVSAAISTGSDTLVRCEKRDREKKEREDGNLWHKAAIEGIVESGCWE